MNPSDAWYKDDAFRAASFPFMVPPESFERGTSQAEKVVQISGRAAGAALDYGPDASRLVAVATRARGATA